jgi:hypothetical protein
MAVDLVNQFRQRHVSESGDFLEAIPERLFKVDAGLVTRYDNSTHWKRAQLSQD